MCIRHLKAENKIIFVINVPVCLVLRKILCRAPTHQWQILAFVYLWFTNILQKRKERKDKLNYTYMLLGILRVTWYPTGRREIKLLLLVFELTVSSRQRVTVKEECRSQRGYQQVLVLSNLRSLDTKGEKREAKWLAGTPKRKWGLLPLSGSK